MAYHLCTVHPEAINDVAEKMQHDADRAAAPYGSAPPSRA